MRACLDLIVSHEAELMTRSGNVSSGKPHFIDTLNDSIVVQLNHRNDQSNNKKQK